MILAKGLRFRGALARLGLLLTVAGPATGCQSAERTARTDGADGGWQVVERLGEARYQPGAGGGWSPAMPASTLEDGSRVATGAGGRLIVARPGQHISAGPASRFTLPDAAPGAPLDQQAGWLRYRVAEATPGGLLVMTPFLEIEVARTVFDVTVSTTATEVSVEQGRVRIATPDGRRQIELGAGQSAYAGGAQGDALAFRRTADAPLEQVATIVLPAMHPHPGMHEGRSVPAAWRAGYAHGRASTSGTAVSEATVPIAKAEIASRAAAMPPQPQPVAAPRARPPEPVRADRPAATGESAIHSRPAVERSAGGARSLPPPSEAARRALTRQEAGDEAPEKLPPSAFDRLSEGMVQGVPAVLQSRDSAVDARRSF
jgi:FecR protein